MKVRSDIDVKEAGKKAQEEYLRLKGELKK